MRSSGNLALWSLVLLAVAMVLAIPENAHACGGTFCQTPMQPVVQAGEDIVYVKNADGTLTMSVRIVYQGSADGFAWILPLPNAPTEIGVGTDALFQGLAVNTTPSFIVGRSESHGTCRQPPRCDFPMSARGGWVCTGCGYAEAGSVGSGGGFSDAASVFAYDAAAIPPVEVVARTPVGPYESVVLRGGSATEIQAWLTDNGYFIPESAIPLMEDYAAAGQVFVALRLLTTSTVNSIRPIVLHLGENDPCLPIRLTSIATVRGLPITTYFLADSPAVPTNYSLIDAPEDVRLYTGTTSWSAEYANAIAAAGGQAFVFDSAQAPPTLTLALPPVDDLVVGDTTFAELTQQLSIRGYQGETGLVDLLARFLEGPADETTYLRGCLSFFTCDEPTSFDRDGFFAALETEIRAPRAEADAWLADHPVLTRLYTSMSAENMTLDPEFRFDPGIDLLPAQRSATAHILCSEDWIIGMSPQELELPSGARVSWFPGTSITDDAFCRSRGGTLHTESASSGCTVLFGTSAPAARGLSIAAAIVLVLAHRRRRRA
jgi:hypothetical protein